MMSDSLPDEAIKFLTQMGLCIAAWAQVDDALFSIFERYVGTPRPLAAIIYYRSPGLETRFGLVDEIVTSVWTPESLEEGSHQSHEVANWRKAQAGRDKLLSVRRRIAHQPFRPVRYGVAGYGMGSFGYNVAGVYEQGNPPFEIYANAVERLRKKEWKSGPIDLATLHTHETEVYTLRDRLKEFLEIALPARP